MIRRDIRCPILIIIYRFSNPYEHSFFKNEANRKVLLFIMTVVGNIIAFAWLVFNAQRLFSLIFDSK